MSDRETVHADRAAFVNVDAIREVLLLCATRKPAGNCWCAGLVRAGRGDGQRDSHRSTYGCLRSAGRPAPMPRLSGRSSLRFSASIGAR